MKQTFLTYVANNFKTIKNKFELQIKRVGLSFDEDIFSDTILKCNEKLKESNINDKEMLYYFWMAFKNNTLREIGYIRNNTTDQIPEDIIDEYDDEKIDLFDVVTKLIIDEFGEEIYQLFSLHANGMTYEELYKITKKENLKYIFRKVREYVRGKIKKERD